MNKALVGIIMGSDSDLPIMSAAALMRNNFVQHTLYEVIRLVYNHLPNENQFIADESIQVLKRYLHKNSLATHWLECPEVNSANFPALGCSWMTSCVQHTGQTN